MTEVLENLIKLAEQIAEKDDLQNEDIKQLDNEVTKVLASMEEPKKYFKRL